MVNDHPFVFSKKEGESEAGEVCRVLSEVIDLTQALEGLVSYSLSGRNPVADFEHQLKVAPKCGGMPSSEALLPLCLKTCSSFLIGEFKPTDPDSSLVVHLAVGVVNALIFVVCGR